MSTCRYAYCDDREDCNGARHAPRWMRWMHRDEPFHPVIGWIIVVLVVVVPLAVLYGFGLLADAT